MKRNSSFVIGITGNSGSGKSIAARTLQERGAAVIDADKIARAVLEPDGAAYAEVKALFGGAVVNPDGTLNRAAIGGIVFSDAGMLKKHTDITHKYIKKELLSQLEAYKRAEIRIIVIDAPLLIEADLHKLCDAVWLVTAPYDKKIERITARDGLTEDAAKKRIAAQPPEESLAAYADAVFCNNGDIPAFKKDVRAYLDRSLICSA